MLPVHAAILPLLCCCYCCMLLLLLMLLLPLLLLLYDAALLLLLLYAAAAAAALYTVSLNKHKQDCDNLAGVQATATSLSQHLLSLKQ